MSHEQYSITLNMKKPNKFMTSYQLYQHIRNTYPQGSESS